MKSEIQKDQVAALKKRIVSEGIYQDHRGHFSYRPKNPRTGRRTEKRLKARTLRLAILEHAKLLAAPAGKISLSKLAALYLAANCPDRKGAPRSPNFTGPETTRCTRLIQYFGHMSAADIRIMHWLEYKLWRSRRVARKGALGLRAIDQEGSTLSNILNYGVLLGEFPVNYLHHGRPRFHTRALVKPSRERAPASGDELHRLAAFLLDHPKRATQSIGWAYLFQNLIGPRESELLRLRLDAGPREPGYVEKSWLWLKRSKKGINPYAMIHPDFAQCLAAHRAWHAAKYPKSPWYFPGRTGGPLTKGTITKAIGRAAKSLGLPHRTSHGGRSYYVTVRLSQGIPAGQIAAEIGDATGAPIISQSYGDIPANWRGGAELTYRPRKAPPAWSKWAPKNLIPLKPSKTPVSSAGRKTGRNPKRPKSKPPIGPIKLVHPRGVEPLTF